MNFAAMQSISYPRRTIERAERAVRCTPFLPPLFDAMRVQSVDLRSIAGSAGVANRYMRRPVAELAAEVDLLWLIEVGLLRREVDGQGLTDSFRLTPLGRQLVEKWQQGGGWAKPSLIDRVVNLLNRWLRLPSWLQ
ncbi:MAG: hypothetical protein HC895_20505 [Leptolyngbyaceae cyanobacterium SM1_3_5]|nr:hypothetical protein [Leptolyngbyaceae cyanobacterium SM1_3_5]